jgi:hypothetical protein
MPINVIINKWLILFYKLYLKIMKVLNIIKFNFGLTIEIFLIKFNFAIDFRCQENYPSFKKMSFLNRNL